MGVKLAVFALIGAVLTAAVAWGSTLVLARAWTSIAFYESRVRIPVPTPADWPEDVLKNGAAKRIAGAEETRYQFLFIVEEQPGAGLVEYLAEGAKEKRPGAIHSVRRVDLRIVRAGWPLFALRHEYWIETEERLSGATSKRMRRTVGHPTSPWRLGLAIGNRRLGIGPLWPGFAANTAMYGATALVLWSSPGLVRRIARRRRGCCIACGYELMGMTTCPECGAA